MVELDPQVIVKLLEKKERAGAPELGTDLKTMKQLEASGLVRRDGKIHTGNRGKPPIAWVIADGKTISDAAEIEIERPTARQRNGDSSESLQAKIDRAIEKIKGTELARDCHCVNTWDTITAAELRFHPGCKDRWICSSLVKLRNEVYK